MLFKTIFFEKVCKMPETVCLQKYKYSFVYVILDPKKFSFRLRDPFKFLPVNW